MSFIESLVEWTQLDECVIGCLQVSNCTVAKSFGPYEKGEKLESVAFDFEGGKIQVFASARDVADGKPSWRGEIGIFVVDNE